MSHIHIGDGLTVRDRCDATTHIIFDHQIDGMNE